MNCVHNIYIYININIYIYIYIIFYIYMVGERDIGFCARVLRLRGFFVVPVFKIKGVLNCGNMFKPGEKAVCAIAGRGRSLAERDRESASVCVCVSMSVNVRGSHVHDMTSWSAPSTP